MSSPVPLSRFVASILMLAAPAAHAQDAFYVSDPGSTAPSVTTHARAASGDALPLREITGAATGLSGPEKLSIDPLHEEIVVANEGAASVTVYGFAADGDAAPLRTIVGAATLLNQPDVPFVDIVNNEIFVTSNAGGASEAVRVFSRTANGNAAPLRSLIGANTQISDPQGLWVDTVNNELYVANGQGGDRILVFNRGASGNTAPKRVLTGAATLLSQPEGLAVDTVHDELIVANNGTGANDAGINVYPRLASGDTAPIRRIAGAATGFTVAEDVALDLAHDELFVVDETGSVRVFERDDTGDVAPKRFLVGPSTGIEFPQGIRVIPWIFADGFELGSTVRWSP